MPEEREIPKQPQDKESAPEINKPHSTIPQSENPSTNMEVHHHPYAGKKSFKEYFLEFLMIFLAVTLGFFAESYREYLSEHNREKEYIQSLVEDLKNDQEVLIHHISGLQSGIAMMDTMISILDT